MLGSSVPLTYNGSTVGKANLVTSARLEWTDAGDDALLFVAPETGAYRAALSVTSGGCGASVREFGPQMNGMGAIYDPSWCPPVGSSVEIDGIFEAKDSQPIQLTAGQPMLIWVSCSYWSKPLETPYTLTIQKQ